MARQRRAKRISLVEATRDRDDMQNMPERAVESLTELAAASGAQAVRFAAAVARGMAKGMAGAARELRRPISEMTQAASEAVDVLQDSAARGVERATRSGRRAASRSSRRTPASSRRRSA
jgi:hypothetical protein